MTREGIAALVCATVLFTPLIPYLAAEPAERDAAVAATLAVQEALKSGRESMTAGQYGAAVHVLEQQLARINGNREYLSALREAYRGYLKELRQAGRADEAQTYLRRLEILDPGARLDFPDVPHGTAVAVTPPAPAPVGRISNPSGSQKDGLEIRPTEKAPAPKVTAVSPPPTAPPGDPNGLKSLRGNIPDDPPALGDPFHPKNRNVNPAASLVASADHAYREKDYRAAGRLYEQAHEADPQSVTGRRDEWGYCKLFLVKEQFSAADGPVLDRLEAEVREAMALSPRLQDTGKEYLAGIQARRGSGPVTLRHLKDRVGSWSVSESDNFRIFHKEDRKLAEKVAEAAERTRQEMGRKWFGQDGEWKYRCDLYIHPTAADYSRNTGKPATWTAHSTINLEAGRVVLRRIDLRGDDPDLLTASLPHEATHTVLAGHFGTHHVPRWADEGMALLSEPEAKREAYRRKLGDARQNNLLMRVRDLMTTEDYPEPSRAFAFYLQSVSLTDFLVRQPGGPQAFARFVNEALKSNYDDALQKTYGMDMATLEQRWRASSFGDDAATQAAFRGAGR
jgi:tetratricopeptide (TPR) repeat protein